MSIEIRPISVEELDKFQQTMGVPFGFDASPELRDRFKYLFEFDRLRSAYDNGQMVATFGALSLQLIVPGGSLPTAGTTVVTVLTTHRRRGILRRLMREHLAEVHQRREPLAALWASESSIYGRFGYGPATERMVMTLDKQYARMQQPVDIRNAMRMVDRDEAQAVFPDVYQRAIFARPGTFARDRAWWEHRVLSDLEELRQGATSHRRVLYTRHGQPCGYTIYRTFGEITQGPNRVQVIELIGSDPETEKALWQFVFGIDLVSSIQFGNQPVDDPLRWWLQQPRRMERRAEDALWVRVIDVVPALEGRRYSQAGSVVFRLRDDVCRWNEGVYRLEIEQDGTARCRTVDADPEIEFSPYVLGAVYLGGNRLRDLARSGLVTGKADALERADAMFVWHPLPWCQEVF